MVQPAFLQGIGVGPSFNTLHDTNTTAPPATPVNMNYGTLYI